MRNESWCRQPSHSTIYSLIKFMYTTLPCMIGALEKNFGTNIFHSMLLYSDSFCDYLLLIWTEEKLPRGLCKKYFFLINFAGLIPWCSQAQIHLETKIGNEKHFAFHKLTKKYFLFWRKFRKFFTSNKRHPKSVHMTNKLNKSCSKYLYIQQFVEIVGAQRDPEAFSAKQ